MKLISIVVPSYNSENYLDKSVQSLLVGGEDVEIIIVNDGSTDRTLEIAKGYAEEYPTIVKYVDKVNGGHGDAVCAGLAVATGKYFKVCDSDDWFDFNAYNKVIKTVKKCLSEGKDVDLFISNFVYEKVYLNRRATMEYSSSIPSDTLLTWDTFKLKYGKYILMHSVMFKTDVLRESGLVLPKHTFYVDNLFVYIPLKYVNTMYYIDADLYRYFIGREDQSVNEANMIKRIDQQIFVNKSMVEVYKNVGNSNKNLKKYMLSYLQILTTISSILLIKDGTKESLNKKDELWSYFKSYDKKTFNELRFSLQGILLNLPNKLNFIKVAGYKVFQRIWGFN